ncbi:CocE/NonD family hydrolase [Caldisphaera sp.]|uniref:alpha/beta hydrolase n=1 Tax=Caldisphaera sp. TaxID=2060322 RepID=UPI0025BC96F5|nr:CocE/NonD family hydrolase [Caldisphaera sp.]
MTSNLPYEKKETFFPCNGEKCHGILYLPSGIKKAPALVMGMGFGMVKEVHADDYAPYFAQKGIAVFVFDYRRFGRSEGMPRQALYPMDQVSDYRCAISFMKTIEKVDPNRICVWGTSFSGGHVLTLLAFPEPGLKCGISQVPNVYSYRTALEYFGSLEPVLMLYSQNSKDCCEGRPSYIPIVSKDGIAALMTKEAYEYYTSIASKYETFENKITLDSLTHILAYNPGDYSHLIKKPLLMIIASKDQTTPPKIAKEVADRIKSEVTIKEYNVGHFEIYKQPLLNEIAIYESAWLLERL